MLVEMNLLRGHRLRLDDALDALLSCEIQDVLAHLRGIVGAEYFCPAGLGVFREEVRQFVKMRCGIGFSHCYLRPQRLEVVAFIRLRAADAVGFGKSPESPGQTGIMNRFDDGLAKLGFHQFTLPGPSKKMMMSFSGPCTPMVSTRSMSAVRLGPVMKEM